MTTYSISLDDVDLALLPLRSQTYNDFLKKELYEFRVMKADPVEDPIPNVLYTCHICAIDVPAAFASEHAASDKHRANARIARVAALRTRSLITALPPPPAPRPNAPFCPNCCATVGRNHENTKAHRVAVLHDKLLVELVAAYVGNARDHLKGDTDSYSDDEEVNEEINNGNDRINKELNNKFNGIERENDNIGLKIDINGKDSIYVVDKHNDKDYKNVRSNNSEVKNVVTTKAKSIDSSPNVSNIIEPEAKNDRLEPTVEEVEEVDRDGYVEEDDEIDYSDSNYSDYDINSDVEVIETENIESIDNISKASEKFDTNEEKPPPKSVKPAEKMEYIKFATKGNKQVKVLSNYYHSFVVREDKIECVVCDSVFNNCSREVNSHMFSVKHFDITSNYMIDAHCVRKINTVYSHCILCNQKIKNTNIVRHLMTLQHKNRETQVGINIDRSYSEAVINTTNTVNEDVKIIEKNESDNMVNLKNMTKSWLLKFDAKNEAETVTANKNPEAGGSGLKTEKKAEQNPEKITEVSTVWPVIFPYEVTELEGTVRCIICDCKVPRNPENRKEHLVGSNHKKNVEKKRVSLQSALVK